MCCKISSKDNHHVGNRNDSSADTSIQEELSIKKNSSQISLFGIRLPHISIHVIYMEIKSQAIIRKSTKLRQICNIVY